MRQENSGLSCLGNTRKKKGKREEGRGREEERKEKERRERELTEREERKGADWRGRKEHYKLFQNVEIRWPWHFVQAREDGIWAKPVVKDEWEEEQEMIPGL